MTHTIWVINYAVIRGYHKIKHFACHRDFFLHEVPRIKQTALYQGIKHFLWLLLFSTNDWLWNVLYLWINHFAYVLYVEFHAKRNLCDKQDVLFYGTPRRLKKFAADLRFYVMWLSRGSNQISWVLFLSFVRDIRNTPSGDIRMCKVCKTRVTVVTLSFWYYFIVVSLLAHAKKGKTSSKFKILCPSLLRHRWRNHHKI